MDINLNIFWGKKRVNQSVFHFQNQTFEHSHILSFSMFMVSIFSKTQAILGTKKTVFKKLSFLQKERERRKEIVIWNSSLVKTIIHKLKRNIVCITEKTNKINNELVISFKRNQIISIPSLNFTTSFSFLHIYIDKPILFLRKQK